MYEIKFLSSKDFDNLPVEVTRGSDISDSLGFYNPYLERAYIRWTAYPELNKYLLDHEFEHMLEGDATDVDENGIRHKKFFKEILAPLVSGFNLETGKFSPLGILGDTSRKEEQAPQPTFQEQAQQPSFFNPFYSSLAGNQPTFGTGVSKSELPESTQGGLNAGISSIGQPNPFRDRFKYGAPAGRLSF